MCSNKVFENKKNYIIENHHELDEWTYKEHKIECS